MLRLQLPNFFLDKIDKLRIISGKYRSRAIKAPKSDNIRPTSDKVKGALFNMLGNLHDCTVVDFYSGTGNLGLEALSRGAAQVVMVEKAPESLKLILENLTAFGLNPRDLKGPIQLMAQDVSKAFYLLHQGGKKFDILLADPPYEKGALKRLQSLLIEYPILQEGGIFAIEHRADDIDLVPDFPYPMVRQKKYGDTYLTLFRFLRPGEQLTEKTEEPENGEE